MSTPANKPCKKCGLVAPEPVKVFCKPCKHRFSTGGFYGTSAVQICQGPPDLTETNYYMERKVNQKCSVKNADNDCQSFQAKEPEPEPKPEQRFGSGWPYENDPPEVQGTTGVHWTAWLFLCLTAAVVGAWVGTIV